MPVLTITNQKGGVGKTTTTLNLAAALQQRGWRVLVVDFDPQGNLTTCCGLGNPDSLDPKQPTLAAALLTTVHGPSLQHVTLPEVIVSTPAGIDLVPANKQLAAAEAALYTVYGREYALRDTLRSVHDRYDVILVDSVPTLGLLAINGLAAADGLIIPVQAEYLAVHGLAQLLESVATARERLNPRLDVWGVVLTMVDNRTKHSKDIVSAVRSTLPSQVPVFNSQIPEYVKLKDSTKAGVSILAFDPGGRATIAYQDLAGEVEIRLGSAIAEATPPRSPWGPSVLQQADAERRLFQDGATVDRDPTIGAPIAQPVTVGPATPEIRPSQQHPATVCPMLGLLDNRSERLEWVSSDHRCFSEPEPAEIAEHAQRLYCLADRHETCGRLLRARLNPPVAVPERSPSILSRVRSILAVPAAGMVSDPRMGGQN